MATYRILAVPPPGRRPSWPILLAAELGVPHLCVPELARAAIERRTQLGEALAESLLRGDFLDEPLVEELVAEAVRREGHEGFVLSGMPLSAELLVRVARAHAVTHAVATLGGLPERVTRAVEPLGRVAAAVLLPSDAADDEVQRRALALLR